MSLFKKIVPLWWLPLVAAALGACSSTKPKFQDDQLFSSTASPYSHDFDFSATDACEAARRGLLSQGYMTTMTHTDAVDATKNFQPESDSHIVVEVHVVCTAGDASNASVVYVNAVQNGYALKKSDTSASVGLSIFGSLSVPIRTNSDAMVKISSETIQSGSFYDKFFELVSRYLRNSARTEPVPHGAIEITPLPAAAMPSPPVAVVTPAAPATALASRAVAPVIGSPAAGAGAAATGVAGGIAADVHAAAPAVDTASTAVEAAAPVSESASAQPVTSGGTRAATAAPPGIGEPPMLAAPANDRTAAAAGFAAQASSIAQTSAAPPSNEPERAAPAPASGTAGASPVAVAPATESTAATAAQ